MMVKAKKARKRTAMRIRRLASHGIMGKVKRGRGDEAKAKQSGQIVAQEGFEGIARQEKRDRGSSHITRESIAVESW